MKQIKVAAIAVMTLIAVFFLFAVVYPAKQFCTTEEYKCTSDGEIQGNVCSVYKPVFVSILLNYGKTCTGREIISCQENKQVGRRVELNGKCSYIWNNVFTNAKTSGTVVFDNMTGN